MASSWSARRAEFRAILAGDATVHPASVFDPVSARVAEDIGFECLMFAGSVASLVVLGAPDNVTLTLSEFADQARRICRATARPLMVDADHGYGNALNVIRTVEELEAAGVSGLTIEDTALPEPYGVPGKASLIPLEEGIGKMQAAVAARGDGDIAVIARTGAAGIANIEEAIRRVSAYQDTGVDAIFLSGIKTREEVVAVGQVSRLPVLLGGTPSEIKDKAFLAANGVRIALQGHGTYQAAVAAVEATMRALRDGVDPEKLEGLASGDTMRRVMRADVHAQRRRAFLGR